MFGRMFAKFEDPSVVHVGDQVLRFFAELVDLLRLSQVLNKRFFILVALELFDQPLDFVLAFCTLQKRGTPGILWSTMLLQVSP